MLTLTYRSNWEVEIAGKRHPLSAVAQKYNCFCGRTLIEKRTPDGWRAVCPEHGATTRVEKKTTTAAREHEARLAQRPMAYSFYKVIDPQAEEDHDARKPMEDVRYG